MKLNKSKVLLILHLAPPVHGAAVVGGFIKDSEIINDTFDGTYINLATASSLVDVGKSSLKKVLTILNLWRKVYHELKSQKYQLCYLTINAKGPAWFKEMGIVALVKLFKVPIIYHYHNKGVADNATTVFKKLLYRFQFRNTKSILLSPLLYQDLASFVRESDVYYCPNGIAPTTHINKEELLKEESKKCTLLFLSNLIESKGIYILLEACALLKKKQLAFHCVFIGADGEVSGFEFNEKIEHMNLQNEVEYQGKKYGLEKEAAFSSADIFVFPTYYHNETFGLVNLEAMQYSLPIVSTFEGAIAEVIIDGVNGFLVPQRNAQKLAEKLEILILNPILRKGMGLAGKKLYEDKYTIEIFEKRMLAILEDALK